MGRDEVEVFKKKYNLRLADLANIERLIKELGEYRTENEMIILILQYIKVFNMYPDAIYRLMTNKHILKNRTVNEQKKLIDLFILLGMDEKILDLLLNKKLLKNRKNDEQIELINKYADSGMDSKILKMILDEEYLINMDFSLQISIIDKELMYYNKMLVNTIKYMNNEVKHYK